MDCRSYRARIPAMVDRELGDADAAELRKHLPSCPACAAAARLDARLVERLRAAAGTETAPAGLAERVRASLAELPRGSADDSPRQAPTARRAVWGLALAAAAALLAALVLPWSASGNGMVAAMAQEHSRHVDGRNYHHMDIVSADNARIEQFLSEKLGTRVDVPVSNVPTKQGAACCRAGGRAMGLVGCFCQRRNRAVTIFVVRAAGLDLGGLTHVVQDGREFLCGSSGRCQAVLWVRGELCYALVGELDPADIRDMARRAADTLDGRDAPGAVAPFVAPPDGGPGANSSTGGGRR